MSARYFIVDEDYEVYHTESIDSTDRQGAEEGVLTIIDTMRNTVLGPEGQLDILPWDYVK